MTLLGFDISSGGVTAALFNRDLEILGHSEQEWQFATDSSGAATLTVDAIVQRFKAALGQITFPEKPSALCIGCFMHNCVLLDANDQPLTPVFTWLDQRGEDGVTYVRNRLGDRFHERTGCHYHPMFPVFKLAALHLRDAAFTIPPGGYGFRAR